MKYHDNLRSERMTTRFLTPADAAPWEEYCNDPIATRYTKVQGMTAQEMAAFWIERAITRYASDQFGLQALIHNTTGELVGHCGLITQTVNDQPETEVGYHLLRRYWSNGYATEAAQLFRDYGFRQHAVSSIVSIIHPLNDASQQVALRNGMTLVDNKARFRDGEYCLYRITRAEWEQLQRG